MTGAIYAGVSEQAKAKIADKLTAAGFRVVTTELRLPPIALKGEDARGGDASEQEGGRCQDLRRNEVQQGQGSSVLAVRLHDDGLKVEEIETPSPDPGEVLVRVHAAAITRDELEWPVDRLPAIPSYELSGVVVGSGDEVYALTPFDRDGVAAEYAVVPADVLAPKPLRLSHVEAAALPMGGLTAWQALFVHGRLARGKCWSRAPGAGLGTSPSSLRDTPAQRSWRAVRSIWSSTLGGGSPLASAWSRSQRRCRARSTSSSNPTTSNCWS